MLVLIIIIITKNMKNMIGTIRRDILMSLQVKTFGTVIIDHAVIFPVFRATSPAPYSYAISTTS